MRFKGTKTKGVLIFLFALFALGGTALAGPSDVGEAIVGSAKVAAPPTSIEAPEALDAGASKAPDAGVEVIAPGELPDEIEKDPVEVATRIVGDIKSGNWRMVAAGVLVLIMLGVARFRDKIKFFRGDRGGAVLVALVSLAGALVTSLYAGVSIDLAMVIAAFGTTWTAVGSRDWLRTVINPPDQALERAETIDE